MSVVTSALRWDGRLQYRYGIYAAAVVVTLTWVALLFATPAEVRAVALPAVLFGDTAIFGFYLPACSSSNAATACSTRSWSRPWVGSATCWARFCL